MALDVSISKDLALVFSTPISVRSIPDADALNDRLAEIVLDWRKTERSAVISNVGGWQSPPTLFQRPEPEFRQIRAHVDEAVRALMAMPAMVAGRKPSAALPPYKATAWVNVNGDGDYNQLHVHPRNHWAVVYYVTVGAGSNASQLSGKLELRDPRPTAIHGPVHGFTFGQPLAIEPKPGLMVAFPAWLEHWVHPYQGPGERISIAVNIEMIPN
jgi:uncharacterized protein (TIGR02466 family)